MMMAIVLIPLVSSVGSGLGGRWLGARGAGMLATGSLVVTAILALIVGLSGEVITVRVLDNWVESGWLTAGLGFRVDSLTAMMLILITTISTLVHCYSIGYMSGDPHVPRFFSYLSLFTFFMIVLVTGENLIMLFLGWEGDQRRPKSNTRYLHTKAEKEAPFDDECISALVGWMLGDGHIDKRKPRRTARFIIKQSGKNVEYLMWVHKFLASRGLCSQEKPKLKTTIGRGNKVQFYYNLNSYAFTYLNILHERFYKDFVKVIPSNIGDDFTALSLAIWIMDDGCRHHAGVYLAINSFTYAEVNSLAQLLKDKFGLISSVHVGNKAKNQYLIYIKAESKQRLVDIVKPHILESMRYKFGDNVKWWSLY